MIQVLMDGPNFNLKFLKDLSSSRPEIEIPALINIGIFQTLHLKKTLSRR